MRARIWGRVLAAGLFPLAAVGHGAAETISLSGNLQDDSSVVLYNFDVQTGGLVTLQTFSYAGGVDAEGAVVAAGGFDPVLTLFDMSGNFLVSNDDGPCGTVGADPTTGNCFDSFISGDLAAGSYTVALTEYDNLPAGSTLADSFTEVGNGNFTCQEFLGTPGGFCDDSPSQRDSAYELDVITPGAAPAITPEPASGVLVLSCVGFLAAIRGRLNLKGRRGR